MANSYLTREPRIFRSSLFNKWWGENQITTCKTIKSNPYRTLLTHTYTSNLKWIKELNVNPQTVKFVEENIRKKLLDTGLSDGFLNIHQALETTQPTLFLGPQWDVASPPAGGARCHFVPGTPLARNAQAPTDLLSAPEACFFLIDISPFPWILAQN